jgi:hypothetical protein
MAEVTELITRFSFSGSTGPLEDYNGSLGKSIGLLAGMGAALGVAVLGVGKWVTGISQSLQPLIDLNAQTGVSVERIQELSFIAEQSSSSTEALYSSISGLGAKIGEAAQKGSEDFSRLGVSVRNANGSVKDTDVVLSEVGNRFKQLGLSMNEQQGFAEALGIDPSLLSMMNKTGEEMATLRGEAQRLGVLTADQVKSAQDYNNALGKLGFGMESVKRFIAVGLAPELTEMAKDFTDLLAANKDWIINGIKATVGVLRDMVDALIRVAPFIAAVGAAFLLAKVYTLGFAGSLALVFSPAILIAAGIAAVLVVLDDLIVAFQGGKSIIRDFFMEFLGFDIKPVLEGIVKVFNDVVGTIFDGAKIIFDAIEPMVPLLAVIGSAFVVAAIGPAIFAGSMALIASPVTAIVVGIAGIVWAVGDLSKALSGGQSVIRDFFLEFFGFDIKPLLVGIVEGFKEVLETLKNFGAGVFDSWVEIFSGIGDILAGNFSDGFDKIGEGFSDMVDTWGDLFRSVFSGIFDWAKNAVINIVPDWVLDIIGPDSSGSPSASPGGSQALQPGGGRANNVGQYDSIEQTVIMDIRTADPEKEGKAASDGLQRQLEDARNQTRGRGGS